MRNLKNSIFLVLSLFVALMIGCKDDTIAPVINTTQIEDNDLIQVTNATPYVPVQILASGSSLTSVTVTIKPVSGKDTIVATNTLHNITNSNLSQFSMTVPFPLPKYGPSGQYSVNYTVTNSDGKSESKSYLVNILNARTKVAPSCDFPTQSLPAGKNVWVQITAPETTGSSDVYIVGNFQSANGGSDWSPGDPNFKMTRIAGTNCFYIAVSLADGNQIKFTRGDWGSVMKDGYGNDNKGDGFSNPDGNIIYNSGPFTGATVKFSIANWADRVVPAPIALPTDAIKTGMITMVADVGSINKDSKYFLVKDGATTSHDSIPLITVVNSSMLAAAVPKVVGDKWVVVKDNISKIGLNAFGTARTIAVDGVTNPTRAMITGFKTEFSNFTDIPSNLFIVGDATPGGWNNPVPTPSQQFASSSNVYTLTLTLSAKQYLLLPVNGDWSHKFGMGGSDPLSGDLVPDGGNFLAPSDAGTYSITVDFNVGTYKLIKQ